MRKALPFIFFFAWILSGCCVETMLDDWRACVVAVAALITVIMVAVVIGGGRNDRW